MLHEKNVRLVLSLSRSLSLHIYKIHLHFICEEEKDRDSQESFSYQIQTTTTNDCEVINIAALIRESEKFNLSVFKSSYYGTEGDSVSNTNEYQVYHLRGKSGRCVGLTLLPSRSDWLDSTS